MHGWIGSPVLDHNFSIFVHFFHDFYPIPDSHQKLKGSKWHEKRGKILKIKIYGRYLPESQSNVKEQYLKIQSGMRINHEIQLLMQITKRIKRQVLSLLSYSDTLYTNIYQATYVVSKDCNLY